MITINYDFHTGKELSYVEGLVAEDNFETNVPQFFSTETLPNVIVKFADGSFIDRDEVLTNKYGYTNKDIRKEHNLCKMLIAGSFTPRRVPRIKASTHYVFQDVPSYTNTIFLAGPTHRIVDGQFTFKQSWREAAVEIFRMLDFKGALIIPEWEKNRKPMGWTYVKQVAWEVSMLEKCSLILFWIPRDMKELPALTTNVEFGYYLDNPKSIAGSPDYAEKNTYLIERFKMIGKPWASNLYDLCKYATTLL